MTLPVPSKVRRRTGTGRTLGHRHRYPGDVADAPRLITAEEHDAMSPDERARMVREHIVTNLDHLPDDFRRRVEATAGRLAEQGRRPVTE